MDDPVVPGADRFREPDGIGVVHVLVNGVAGRGDAVDEEKVYAAEEVATLLRDIEPGIGGVGDPNAVVLKKDADGVDRRVVDGKKGAPDAEEVEGSVCLDGMLRKREEVEKLRAVPPSPAGERRRAASPAPGRTRRSRRSGRSGRVSRRRRRCEGSMPAGAAGGGQARCR